MKQIFFLILIIFSFLSGIFLTQNLYNRNTSLLSPLIAQEEISQETFKIGAPKNLIIPKIGVNTFIEGVGLDQMDRMDVPSSPYNVGWYNLGVKPGEKGNAVIDGHLDSEAGPAVFYSLSQLGNGDLITIADERGKDFHFRVFDKKTYASNSVPLEQIFGPSDKASLNLITCGGFFNQTTKNYSERVVVYSELVEEFSVNAQVSSLPWYYHYPRYNFNNNFKY